MDITVFKEVTTEDVIKAFEDDAVLYKDLYVDMKEAEQRKFVKDNASDITFLRKTLDTSRIALTKKAKLDIDKEFKSIDERLAKANEPFTLLIDAHNAERKIELDNEKARLKALDDLAQKEVDHEFALMVNKTYEFDQAQLVKFQQDRDKEILDAAVERLVELGRKQKQDKINEDNARLANSEYVASVKREILDAMLEHDISEKTARLVIRLMVHNKLPKVSINY